MNHSVRTNNTRRGGRKLARRLVQLTTSRSVAFQGGRKSNRKERPFQISQESIRRVLRTLRLIQNGKRNGRSDQTRRSRQVDTLISTLKEQ